MSIGEFYFVLYFMFKKISENFLRKETETYDLAHHAVVLVKEEPYDNALRANGGSRTVA